VGDKDIHTLLKRNKQVQKQHFCKEVGMSVLWEKAIAILFGWFVSQFFFPVDRRLKYI